MADKARLKLLIDNPRFFIRPRNTDWRYMRALARLQTLVAVDVAFPANPLDGLAESASYVAHRLASRIGGLPDRRLRSGMFIRRDSLRADVVLSHRRVPLGLPRPLVWFYSVIDPAMQAAAGTPDHDIDRQYRLFEEAAQVATLTQVSTAAERARHVAMLPGLADRLTDCPFLLPEVSPIDRRDMAAKQRSGEVEILFVGIDGLRKGADLLVEAVGSLRRQGHPVRLTVVTAADLPPPAADVRDAIDIRGPAPAAEVRALMARAQIFAMPSRFESYGLTLIEALAQGCAVLGPDWENQRDILQQGVSGINARATVAAIKGALACLLDDPVERCRIASAGLDRFHDHYAAPVVAGRLFGILQRARDEGTSL